MNLNKNKGWSWHILKRPVFMIVLNIFLLMFGGLLYKELDWRAEPAPRSSTVYICTRTNVSFKPQFMEKNVTSPLESSLFLVKGIDSFHSRTTGRESVITVNFKEGINLDQKIGELRDVISKKQHSFHKEIIPPVIQRYDDAGSGSKVMDIFFFCKNITKEDMANILRNQLRKQIKALEGVGKVSLVGATDEAIEINYKPELLASMGLYPAHVSSSIREFIENSDKFFGTISSEKNKFKIVSSELISTEDDLRGIFLKNDVKLGDIAEVKIVKKERSKMWCNGQDNTLGLEVFAMAGSNPVKTSDLVLQSLKEFVQKNPSIEYHTKDFQEKTKDMFKVAKRSFVEACLLIIFIIFIFIWSMGATIIPIFAIPISIIGTIIPMKLLGYSINDKTLAAFIMATGLVVDDTILIIERVFFWMKTHEKIKAISVALEEMAFSIIVMTLTLACVFFPLIFAPGDIGNSLREYAATLSFSVIISGISSLTLTPVLCIYLLKNHHNKTHENALAKMENSYSKILKKAFNYRKTVTSIVFGLFAFSCYIAMYKIPKEDKVHGENDFVHMVPYADQFGFHFTKSFIHAECEKISKLVEETKMMEFFSVSISEGDRINIEGTLKKEFISYKDKQRLLKHINSRLSSMVFTFNEEKEGDSVSLVIYGDDKNQIRETKRELSQFLMEYADGIHSPTVSSRGIILNFDPNQLKRDNLNIKEIASMMTELLSGEDEHLKSPIRKGEKKYKVFIAPLPPFKESFENVKRLPFSFRKEKKGEEKKFSLDNYFTLKESTIVDTVYRHKGKSSESLTGLLKPGIKIGNIIDKIELFKKKLPSGVSIDFRGESKDYVENSAVLILLIILACFFIFLIVAAQFESFIDSFLVMLAVPLSASGAVAAMWYLGSLNRSSMVGLITLIGLMTKHSIMFVTAANEKKCTIPEIIDSAKERVRPVLMTTFAMVLGMIPLALEKRDSMLEFKHLAAVIVGGLSFGTLLTIFVLPLLYFFVKTLVSKTKAFFEKKH